MHHAPPAPAEPVLASTLLPASSLDSILDTLHLTAPPVSNALALNNPSLNSALGPAFQPASLVALSAEEGANLASLAHTLLIDALLRYPEHGVAVVDTTGHFDVVRLFRGVLARLEGECEGGAARERAAGMLERVRILRVFDFVGVGEAVGELRGELEGRVSGDLAGVGEGEGNMAGDDGREGSLRQGRRMEVADSEDEEEDLETEDDEMLFDSPARTTASAATTTSAAADEQPTANPTHQSPLKTILIDNLAHVLTPLLKQDTISANTLAATFLTTLSNLTRTHALHTILLNPCTPPPPTKSPAAAAQSQAPQPPPPPSIFSSNGAVPALLGLMSRYADTHVLVSTVPRRKLDARVYYADSGRERGKRRGVETGVVAEVVADRWGGRVGAWGAFKVGRDGGVEEL